MNPQLMHKHLLISAAVSDLPSDISILQAWFIDLVAKIRMKLVPTEELHGNAQNPLVYDCKVIGNAGFTVAGVIETSHIVIHTWTETNPAIIQLDVYSCPHFTPEEVFEHFDVFKPVKLSYKFLDRENGLEEVKF
jgi:S-adenosylmethionine/arginine decarboxylase-like enzyme